MDMATAQVEVRRNGNMTCSYWLVDAGGQRMRLKTRLWGHYRCIVKGPLDSETCERLTEELESHPLHVALMQDRRRRDVAATLESAREYVIRHLMRINLQVTDDEYRVAFGDLLTVARERQAAQVMEG